ncbi:MAG: saccharopine dehydrogenase NADP-binding domain-containing protein, partial [Silvanigrellaceae bacterium]|nr:saccharopine dehydrogenase NADP-binding domain-containing protein [Silvanigrellaceae bacterium]
MSLKKNVAVFGAGKIGKLVVNMLSQSDDYHITVLDSRKDAAKTAASYSSTGQILKNVDYDQAD